MGDVSPHVAGKGQAFRFDHLHLSCGVGARYDTPVGPIRVDIGYRVQPLQVLGFANETAAYNHDPSNGVQPTILGLPIAIAVGIGEAY
jgi:outer membrane protein insertion porin family/translocation and assembly module TamA